MIKIPKKYFADLAKIPKRQTPDGPGIHKDSTIIIAVCIIKFFVPEDKKYREKLYEPLKIYFGIEDKELSSSDDSKYWIYTDRKKLKPGYWFNQKEFETYFRMIKDGTRSKDEQEGRDRPL